jgi:hypothetical protein
MSTWNSSYTTAASPGGISSTELVRQSTYASNVISYVKAYKFKHIKIKFEIIRNAF